MSGFGAAATDWIVGLLVVAAIYVLVRPGSKAGLAVVTGLEAISNLVLMVTGPYPA